jgi:hypothetical protein
MKGDPGEAPGRRDLKGCSVTPFCLRGAGERVASPVGDRELFMNVLIHRMIDLKLWPTDSIGRPTF